MLFVVCRRRLWCVASRCGVRRLLFLGCRVSCVLCCLSYVLGLLFVVCLLLFVVVCDCLLCVACCACVVVAW